MRPLLLALAMLTAAAGNAAASDPVSRGEYVFRAAGGCSCHTNFADGGPELAGGRPLETPFGVFYSTNITPDLETGIGRWSDEDFIRAMKRGEGPDGTHYFPVFPYTSFTQIRAEDLRDLKAYLFSLPAVSRANLPHEATPPLGWRVFARAWKWMFFEPTEFEPDPARDDAWNRGKYLTRALAHCGECHTPRSWAGVMDPAMDLAGTAEGPDGELAPNITPDEATGIGEWSKADLSWFLQTGLKADGDDTQGLMSELIEHGYSHLTREDRQAIATYLESVAPIENRVRAREP